MASKVTADQLTTAYGQSATQIRGKMLAFLLALWSGLPDYRDASAAGFIRQAVPVVSGAQQQIAHLTASFLSLLLSAQTGTKVPPVTVRPQDVAKLRGVNPAELYQRPFVQVYTELSKGTPFPAAVERGRIRLVDLASTDAQLAKTHTAQRAMRGNPRVSGYRRVLNGPENCGLCVIASTQRYHKADLLPIHPGCDCGLAPIIGDDDPGQVLDRGLVEGAHAAIADRFGQADRGGRQLDYRKVLLVQQHGEIGPVLTVKGQHFTGPRDLT